MEEATMKWLLVLLLLVMVGCADDPSPVVLPPKFAKGDIVRCFITSETVAVSSTSSQEIAIVCYVKPRHIQNSSKTIGWDYGVMVRADILNLEYKEEDLTLIKRCIFADFDTVTKAEISPNETKFP